MRIVYNWVACGSADPVDADRISVLAASSTEGGGWVALRGQGSLSLGMDRKGLGEASMSSLSSRLLQESSAWLVRGAASSSSQKHVSSSTASRTAKLKVLFTMPCIHASLQSHLSSFPKQKIHKCNLFILATIMQHKNDW